MSGRLFLIPTPIGELAAAQALPASTLIRLRALDLFFVESAKTARAVLKAAEVARPIAELTINEVPRDANASVIGALLQPVLAGRDAGVLSDAGAPGIADPGSALARRAHALGIAVLPCGGTSAIVLALMASGLEGQRFSFHGYLPVEAAPLREKLKQLERAAQRERATQIFIETPYRNDRMLAIALESLRPETLVCVAAGLETSAMHVRTATVSEWRRTPFTIGKVPAVFLLLAI